MKTVMMDACEGGASASVPRAGRMVKMATFATTTLASAALATSATSVACMGAGESKGGVASDGVKSATMGSEATPTVVFVLGGPGAGKGTQCANVVRTLSSCTCRRVTCFART